jgi:stage V sporulation protein R
MSKLLFTDEEWTWERLEKTWEVIKRIATEKYNLDVYDTNFEVITSKQMVEHYATHGMPIVYNHWSAGKYFQQTYKDYLDNKEYLAYEIVVNTDPCICYLMENNTMSLQMLVMAHAAIGHNNFFKNNYMMKNNTSADFIIEYCSFSNRYIAECEAKYGAAEVMLIIDVAHSVAHQSMLPKRPSKSNIDLTQHRKDWQDYLDSKKSDLDSLTGTMTKLNDIVAKDLKSKEDKAWVYPENDFLYYFEKNLKELPQWKKEIFRIVRIINSYWYPNILTKVMNEGWASYWEKRIIDDLWEEGYITTECYITSMHDHTSVVNDRKMTTQYRDGTPWVRSLNPYYLGYHMYTDIERICKNPNDSDREHFPDIAGRSEDWLKILKTAAYGHNDHTFIYQYLSPTLLADLKLVILEDDSNQDYYKIVGTHEPDYFDQTRRLLSDSYRLDNFWPAMMIVSETKANITLGYKNYNDRGLYLEYYHMIKDQLQWLTGKSILMQHPSR